MPDWLIMIIAGISAILFIFFMFLIAFGLPSLALYCIYRFIKYIHQKTS